MTRFQLKDGDGRIINAIPLGGDTVFEVTVVPGEQPYPAVLSIVINGTRGETVFRCNMGRQMGRHVQITRPTVLACELRNCRLIPGRYSITLELKAHEKLIDMIDQGLALDVEARDVCGTANIPPITPTYGYIVPEAHWSSREIA